MRKFLLFVLSILLLISIYKDLSIGMDVDFENNDSVYDNSPNDETTTFTTVKIKVMPGGTFLSIMDEINQQNIPINMDKMLTDFQSLNPNVDPYKLEAGKFYYFPEY